MDKIKWKRLTFGILALFLFVLSVNLVMLYSGLPGTKHLGGIVNLGLAVGFVHLIDLCDDRWSLYVQIIEKENLPLAVAYSGWIIGACIAFPSSIL